MTTTLETAPTTDAPDVTAPGNPLIAGLPGFVIGSIALALQGLGFFSPEAGMAVVPITLGASAISTAFATMWAIRLGDNAVAVVFVTFTGFWVSYSLLSLGLIHGWLAVPAAEVRDAQGIFLTSWLLVLVALTVGTLRLPSIFTLTLVLVDASVALNTTAVLSATPVLGDAAGWCAVGFGAIGMYLLIGAVLEIGGGKPFPLGRPLLRS